MNKVLLIGNLTHDPETRATTSGRLVCGFRVATKRVWVTDAGEKKELTQYHRCVAWDKLGDICGQYLRKGRRVYVEGRLVNREYEKDGEKRTATEVVLDDMILLDARPNETTATPVSAEAGAERREEAQPPASAVPKTTFRGADAEALADEIPF